MKKIVYIGLVALACLGCTKKEKASDEGAPFPVKIMVVATQAERATSRYVGTIEPAHTTPLSMQTTGRVVAVHVKNGQHVQKGQVLIEVDNTQERNALQGAEATLKHAQDGYDRVKQVHGKGVVSDQKMVEIESQLAQARSLYAAAKQRLEECTLTAPCDGVVDGLDVVKGQSILPGSRLCSVVDTRTFSVRFTVPETEIKGLRTAGNKLSGEVECAAADAVLPIVITEQGITANPLTHTYEVTAAVQGGADVLMSGMVAVVKLRDARAETKEQCIVIPARCILLKPEGHTVWMIEQGNAVRRDIMIDGYQADGVRVAAGLQPGDTLIMDGYQKLYKGCKVRVEARCSILDD